MSTFWNLKKKFSKVKYNAKKLKYLFYASLIRINMLMNEHLMH